MPKRKGLVIWFTGLSGSGKTTLAKELSKPLKRFGHDVVILDGDKVRKQLCRDLGYSKTDRDENVRRVAFVAKLLADRGATVLVALVSPYRAARVKARRHIGSERFAEVWCSCTFSQCKDRDPKGLYAKLGSKMTGSRRFPYERPLVPEVIVHTWDYSIQESVRLILYELSAAPEKYISSDYCQKHLDPLVEVTAIDKATDLVCLKCRKEDDAKWAMKHK